jgi:hypothetical protein
MASIPIGAGLGIAIANAGSTERAAEWSQGVPGDSRFLSNVALWCVDNSGALGASGFRCRIIGYSYSQIAAADYSGDPYVTMDFPGDVGHGLALHGSRLMVVPGWNVNANHLGLYTISTNDLVSVYSTRALAQLNAFTLGIFAPTTAGEPRLGGFLSHDGAHWLTGNTTGFSYFNASALTTGVVTSETRIPNGGIGSDSGSIWDIDYDNDRNLWWVNMIESPANGQGGVRMVSRARYEAGETNLVTFQKVFTGSNFAGADGIAFDSLGGFYLSQWAPVRIAYFNAAVVAAGSGSASNPAPTRSLTWPSPNDDSSSIVLVPDGLWQSDWTNGRLRFFSNAQLAAGGLQTPAVTIQTPAGFRPWVVRHRDQLHTR